MLSGACGDFISTIINHLYICDYHNIPVYIVCNIIILNELFTTIFPKVYII